MKKHFKNLLIILVLFLSIAIITGCDNNSNSNGDIFSNNSSKSDSNNSESKSKSNSKSTSKSTSKSKSKSKSNNYELGDTFEFDDLEITLGTNISFTTVDNEYSDYYGKDVIKLPITVKNIKDDTHSLNMFYYKVFGSQGTELKTISTYFDDSVDFAGDLRSGASYEKFIYFVYDGNGEYAIEFNNYKTKINVEFKINK